MATVVSCDPSFRVFAFQRAGSHCHTEREAHERECKQQEPRIPRVLSPNGPCTAIRLNVRYKNSTIMTGLLKFQHFPSLIAVHTVFGVCTNGPKIILETSGNSVT